MNKVLLYFNLLPKKLIIRDFFIYNIIGFNKSTSNTIAYSESYNNSSIQNKNGSINIKTKNNNDNNGNVIVSGANDTTIDTVDTLMNMANNSNNNITKLNLNIGNGVSIALAEEKHEHEHIHDTWGGDIGRAALGGAITGLASDIGVKGGEFLGKLAGNAFSDLVSSSLSKSMTQALTASVNASVNAATISTMNTVGTAMSNTTIYGGNFKDVLKSGRDSLRDKDNLKSIAVSTLGAGITSGLSKYIDGASGGIISKGTMQGASFKDQTFSALLENGLSNSVNVALESSISGDSFKESLKRQGLNMLSGTIETLGASYIGNNYHNNEFSDNKVINKTTQLTLHAGLGAITSKISGGDYLNGAVSGVVGELTAELIGEKYYDGKDSLTDKQKENITNISGLVAGLSSIIVSKSQGQDIEDITTNAYVGQRIGQTASKNNYLLPEEKKSLLDELDKCNGNSACKKEVQNKYEKISDKRDEEFREASYKCTLVGDCEKYNEIHENLRLKLTEEGNEYYNSLSENEKRENFILLPDKKSIYHTYQQDKNGNVINVTSGAESGYTKYVDKVYGYEIVLDGNGNIVTNPVNAGTYNFYNPKLDGVEPNSLINGNLKHILYDVLPYYGSGNSKQDSTTTNQRLLRYLYSPK